MRRSTPALLTAVLLNGCASAQHPWSSRTLCELRQEGPVRGHETWLALLLRGYDPATQRVTHPAVDCTDTQLRWESPVAACFDGALAKTPLPDRPIGERDVVVSTLGDALRLVWVQTSHFASGDALGPVAVVEVEPRRLIVRAIGVLRAYPTRAVLRLERLGDLEVLVADGESCPTRDPASCQRAARVLPLRGERFTPEPLVSEAGACVSAAWFDLAREEAEPLASGGMRRFRLDGALTFDAEGLRIQEQLAVHDLDPHRPQTLPRPVRRAQGERTVRLLAGRLVATGRPLWARVKAGE